MAINLPTDGMDSLGALIQLQMLEQMRPSVPQQPINTPMSLPDLPMDTGMTAMLLRKELLVFLHDTPKIVWKKSNSRFAWRQAAALWISCTVS
jgi:hypothetical protein